MILLCLEKVISDTIVPGKEGGFCVLCNELFKIIIKLYKKNIIVYKNVAVAVLNKIIIKI